MNRFISLKRLKMVLRYSKRTGLFRWRISLNGRIRIGQVAGHTSAWGYVRIQIDGEEYSAHDLAWLYIKEYPPKKLDHKNLRRTDNRIENLRPATKSQNNANKRCYRNNLSGIKGIYLTKKGRWRAQIRRNGTTEHIGYFSSAVLAMKAYRIEARKEFGEFACFRGVEAK